MSRVLTALGCLCAVLIAAGRASSVAAAGANSAVTITSPADGGTASAGTAVVLRAALSTDLASTLQASSACYFRIGDDADSVAKGTLDLNARTCTTTWTFNYAGSYSLTAWVNTSSGPSAMSATITLSVSGGSNPRCTGLPDAPAACAYRWVEVYYSWSNGTRRSRVCAIDGGCQWQTAHTSWSQVAQADYWINSTGSQLPNGDAADAYLCLGSAPADWTSYSSTHDFDALLGRAETSARPLPAGTC